MTDTHSVRPEPVEGLSFLYVQEEGQGFDKLSPNGFSFDETPAFAGATV